MLDDETDITRGTCLSKVIGVGGAKDVGSKDDGNVTGGHHVHLAELCELKEMGEESSRCGLVVDRQRLDQASKLGCGGAFILDGGEEPVEHRRVWTE